MSGHQAQVFATAQESDQVICQLCPHYCHLRPEQVGICHVRYNQDGNLRTMTYGQVSSLALDPIEKKPLYHFYPGAQILSLGSFGCNLGCPWCQNHHIACTVPPTQFLDPEELINLGLQAARQGSIGLAYTYNEPTMAYEYVLDCARKAKAAGLKNVLVTNGYINPQPLVVLLEFTDALNIDLKGFTPQFYLHYCKGSIEPVWDSIELAASLSHVEITTLVIPELNDKPADFREAAYRLSQIDKNIPWHLSAFYPAHRFQNRRPTPPETLLALREIAREYMSYVYLGNIGPEDNDTVCPNCGAVLIERYGYGGKTIGVKEKACINCHAPVSIVM
ncbi:MAG: AmmeMemoRadiSam system radical SAM enzyme [Methylocystaceae bacterium]